MVEVLECGFVGVVAVDEGKVKFLSVQETTVEKMVEVIVYETDIADFTFGKFLFCKLVGFGTAFDCSYIYFRICLCQKHRAYANGCAKFKSGFYAERINNLLYYTAVARFGGRFPCYLLYFADAVFACAEVGYVQFGAVGEHIHTVFAAVDETAHLEHRVEYELVEHIGEFFVLLRPYQV